MPIFKCTSNRLWQTVQVLHDQVPHPSKTLKVENLQIEMIQINEWKKRVGFHNFQNVKVGGKIAHFVSPLISSPFGLNGRSVVHPSV